LRNGEMRVPAVPTRATIETALTRVVVVDFESAMPGLREIAVT